MDQMIKRSNYQIDQMIKRSNDQMMNAQTWWGLLETWVNPIFFSWKKSEKIEKIRQITMKMDGSKISMLVREGTKGKKYAKNNNIELLFKQTNTIVKCFIQCHTYYCYLYYYKYIRPNILFLILKRNTTTSIQCYLISDWRYFQFVL